ncbi:MAG: NINE protein [Bacteroidota bacterium]
MKDKNVAALLALFGGSLGLHRFYLGQVGLGILYLFLFWMSWLIGLIDFFVFLSMDQREFDFKYNKDYIRQDYLQRDTDFDRRDRRGRYQRESYRDRRRKQYRTPPPARNAERPVRRKPATTAPKRTNPYKLSGIRKYKDYDFEGAIEDFRKALGDDAKDVAVHFNIACAYSIMEDADKAFHHLSQAVKYGFVDFNRIHEHDALAYLRIQDGFDTFVKRGYQLEEKATPKAPSAEASTPVPDLLANPNLLEQLKQLGELRDKGLLTEEEFLAQKQRILRS